MGIGFKGGLAAFMEGYNKGEETRYQRERQAQEDAWMNRERDRKVADQEREDKLRDELAEAAKDKQTSVAAHGPMLQENGVDIPIPDIVQSRPQTEEELVRSTGDVYRKAGKLPEALKYSGLAKQLSMDDYATKFQQFRAVAQKLPVKDQVAQAIQIFNDSPNPGTIGNVRFDEKGGVTFDALNRTTGQKVTKTFADPTQLVDDLHAYYSQGSWNKEQEQRAAAAKEAAKPQKLSPGEAVFENGAIKYQNTTESPTVVAARIRAGAGGSGGKPVMPKMTKNEQGELMDEYTGATLKIIPGTPEERPWFGKPKPATPARKVWVDANDNPIPGGLNALYPQLPAADGARPQDAAPKAPANSWNDATGEVISNGKVIGKAKTKEEARALLSKQPKPEPAKPASPMSARPGDADMAMILRNELKQAVQRLEIAKANRDPQAGPRAQQDIEALLREMKRNNISVS